MKKLFTIFICLLCLLCLVGCGEKEPEIPGKDDLPSIPEEITITLNIGVRSFEITKKYKEVISQEDIKLIADFETIELYYDEEYTQKYNGEELEEDINLYLKIEEGSKYLITEKIEEKIKNKLSEVSGIDGAVLYYFGQYKDVHIVMLRDGVGIHAEETNPSRLKIYYYKPRVGLEPDELHRLVNTYGYFIENDYFTFDEYFEFKRIAKEVYEKLY